MNLYGINQADTSEVSSWLEMISNELKICCQEKSQLYEFDFGSGQPNQKISRFEWVGFLETYEKDPSTRPSNNSLGSEFDLRDFCSDD